MADWHGYFCVERLNIGNPNWDALVALFEAMGTDDSDFPAYNNHWRFRLDGDAVIYESLFDISEVSIPAFKQLLADEFGVDVGDIGHTISSADYAGIGTTIWTFDYSGADRFLVERFGTGVNIWQESREETLGYISENLSEWESNS